MKKEPTTRRCYVCIEQPNAAKKMHDLEVFSNLKLTLEYLARKYKKQIKDWPAYRTISREIAHAGFYANATAGDVVTIIIHQKRFTTKLNIPHKQLSIK